MMARVESESAWRTMLITVVVALVCSAMVSGAVLYLRPIQAVYAASARNSVILDLAGLQPANGDERAVGEAFFKLRAEVVDLLDGTYSDRFDPYTYDHWQALELEALDGQSGQAIGLADLPRFVPIYQVVEAEGPMRTILPVHGQGMWSTIHGYIALGADLQTVQGLVIHRHGETPGIGDRVQDPAWLAQWRGRHLYDSKGVLALQVTQDETLPAQHRVDAISGATVTSMAVGRMVGFWLGEQGYGALLQRLREEHGVTLEAESS